MTNWIETDALPRADLRDADLKRADLKRVDFKQAEARLFAKALDMRDKDRVFVEKLMRPEGLHNIVEMAFLAMLFRNYL